MAEIKLQNMTPSPYYNQSRDFQYIGRLYDLVLNAAKTNADQVYNIPLSYDMNRELLDLLATTLGFKEKHDYNTEQLYAVCSTLSEILRNKGNIRSIELAVKAIINADGERQEYLYDISTDNTVISIYIPDTVKDITLFLDLLDYILPAGMECKIFRIRTKRFSTDQNASSCKYKSQDFVRYYLGANENENMIMRPGEATTAYNKARMISSKNGEDGIEFTSGDVTASHEAIQGRIVNNPIYIPDNKKD